MLFEKIPQTMKDAPRWICADADKIPKDPKTGRNASSTNPATWADFATACNAAARGNLSLGFVLGDSWAGVDLDAHDSPINAEALEICKTWGTYCETSRSGNGFHFIGFTDRPLTLGDNAAGVEIYTGGRYFIMTGNALPEAGEPQQIGDKLQSLFNRYAPKRTEPKTDRPATSATYAGDDNKFIREHAAEMLDYIDPASRETWLKVGAALKHEGLSFDVFDSWSKRAANYGGTVRAWNSFHDTPVGGNLTTGATILSLARDGGYQYTPWRDRAPITPVYAPKSAGGIDVPTAAENAAESATDGNNGDILADFEADIFTPKYKPVPLCFDSVNNAIGGGVVRQTLTIITGAPAVGKTALLMQILDDIAAQGQAVTVFNLEMAREQIIARSISRLAYAAGADVSARDVLQAYAQPEATQAEIRAAVDEYRRTIYPNMSINPTETSDILQLNDYITREAEKAKKESRVPAVVAIDYLQFISCTEARGDAAATIKKAVDVLKNYARKYNTFVFLLAAEGRDEQKSNKPSMNASRDSSNAEYSGDYVLQLKAGDEKNLVKMYVVKSRWSASSVDIKDVKGYFAFDGEHSTYTDKGAPEEIASKPWREKPKGNKLFNG